MLSSVDSNLKPLHCLAYNGWNKYETIFVHIKFASKLKLATVVSNQILHLSLDWVNYDMSYNKENAL